MEDHLGLLLLLLLSRSEESEVRQWRLGLVGGVVENVNLEGLI